MDSHQLASKKRNDGVGEWVRHLTKSGKDYFYNVKSHAVQLEKPREWLEYEERHEPAPSQPSSTMTCNTQSLSLHQQQYQSHQSSSSSSNITDRGPCSNTVSSEEAAEYLQHHGNSSSPQISNLHLSHSQVPSPSHQVGISNMSHEICDLGQQQLEDQKLEQMGISDSPIKIPNSVISVKEITSIQYEHEHNYSSLSDWSGNPDTGDRERNDRSSVKDKDNQDGDTNMIMNDNRDEKRDRKDKNRAPKKRKINSMDSHQSSSNGLKSNANLLQNQGALTNNSDTGEIVLTKRRKEETHPLQMQKQNSVQARRMETRSKAREQAMNKLRKQGTNPFKMGHVLGIIFSFLDVDSIKNARQVNRLWSVEGAKVLIAKCFVKIPSNLKNQRNITATERGNRMNKFQEFLAHGSSEASMLSKITLVSRGDANRWRSFVKVKQLKSVKLNFPAGTKCLRKILGILSNLKYLRCSSFWNHSSEYIFNVLTSVMYKAEKNRNPLIVSPIHVQCKDLKQLENIEKFADCNNIMIEELKFESHDDLHFAPNLKTRIPNLLNRLLSASQNVLKILILKKYGPYLSSLEFPCMAVLIKMELFLCSGSLDQPQCNFPPSFRFSENSPNLQEIIVQYSITPGEKVQYKDLLFPILFANTGSAPSVKRVKFDSLFLGSDLAPLFKTFPNITDLHITVETVSTTLFQSLWTLGGNLKRLTLGFVNWQEITCLDSIFAGFTQGTVNEVKKAPNLGHYPLEKLQALRVNPSILNLKELENLTIIFHWRYGRYGAKEIWPDRLLTVAAKYAFNLMPKDLKIDVHLHTPPYSDSRERIRKCLEEVSQLPNVTAHWADFGFD